MQVYVTNDAQPDAGAMETEAEDNVAELFGDFDDDQTMETDVDGMVNAMIMTGVNGSDAQTAAAPMFATNAPDTTFTEVYGRSVHDYNTSHRRNLNVRGLDAFDLRTAKANGEPWNFCKRKDRQEARKIIERKRPMWIIGAPPCTSL